MSSGFEVSSAHIMLSSIMIRHLQQESSKLLCHVWALRRFGSLVLMMRLFAQISW